VFNYQYLSVEFDFDLPIDLPTAAEVEAGVIGAEPSAAGE
jgi:hypothetical protein